MARDEMVVTIPRAGDRSRDDIVVSIPRNAARPGRGKRRKHPFIFLFAGFLVLNVGFVIFVLNMQQGPNFALAGTETGSLDDGTGTSPLVPWVIIGFVAFAIVTLTVLSFVLSRRK